MLSETKEHFGYEVDSPKIKKEKKNIYNGVIAPFGEQTYPPQCEKKCQLHMAKERSQIHCRLHDVWQTSASATRYAPDLCFMQKYIPPNTQPT